MTIAPSRSALLAENQKLKAQLAALREERAPIQIDPKEGRVTIDRYETEQFTIDHLSAQSEGLKDMAQSVAHVEQWLSPPGKRSRTPDFNRPLQQKLTVDKVRMTVPYSTLNKAIPTVAGEQMKKAGVTHLELGKGEGINEIAIKGRAKKFLLDVDFDAKGCLQVRPDGKARFVLGQTRVAGMAVPNFLASLATAVMAGDSMRRMGVTQDGPEFTIDPSKLLPPNIESPLATLSLDESGFVIEGGSKARE